MKHLCFESFISEVSRYGLDIHGILVRQHNVIRNQFHWWDGRRDDIRSCSKSVLSLATGIAIAEGLLSLDERVIDIFPDETPSNPSEYLQEMRIQHLLTMSPGYGDNILHGLTRDWEEDKDWVHYALHQAIIYKPGTRFVYNNASAILVARAIQRRSGEPLLNWLKPRLFDPLNIPNPQWMTCPLGYTIGSGSLFLNLDEMSRIGQLCLNKGMWEGRRLVPAEYIEEATAFKISTEENPLHRTKDFVCGYGYFFWRAHDHDCYRAFGMYGQHIIVLPKHDSVVTIASHIEGDDNHQRLLDAVWNNIIPQLNDEL